MANASNPDWSLAKAAVESLKAAVESLCEHMDAAKAAQESEQRFRAEVAAALAELRASLVATQYPIRDGMSEKEKCVNVGLIAAIHRTDATIAKLGCDATKPASEPPDTARHVIGYFPDQRGSELVWNWTPVFFEGGWWSTWDGDNLTDTIKMWAEVPLPIVPPESEEH